MTTEAVPVLAPCNVCGGSEFSFGPSGRLSLTKRLPTCAKCHSLERHRVVRAAFDALPDEQLAGTRCLQFSPDPALDPARFEEIVVSVWGGQNSLDMQAIALPDACYDWVYSSHVINHIADTTAALREMLRIVGDGCIVLNVGGTVFSYLTAPSQKFCGPDRQFKVYGTLYADEIQEVLPQVAVLELIAVDPCSVTLDSVYFASVNEARLTEMAKSATAHNVHARVFPAKVKATNVAKAPAAKLRAEWKALHTEIGAWLSEGGAAKFWMRDDDATTAHPQLIELADFCERESIPLTLAVIPFPMTQDLVQLISDRPSLTPIQHGFDHQNREQSPNEPKSEFPSGRADLEALRSIQLGWYILQEAFGKRALPVFCPPWGTMRSKLRDRLQELGFTGYSGSRISSELHRRGVAPAGLSLASAHVAVNRPAGKSAAPLPEARILETLTAVIRAIRADDLHEPVGIMTHHWGVDRGVRQFLKRLIDETRSVGAVWVPPTELFPTPMQAPTLVTSIGANAPSMSGPTFDAS